MNQKGKDLTDAIDAFHSMEFVIGETKEVFKQFTTHHRIKIIDLLEKHSKIAMTELWKLGGDKKWFSYKSLYMNIKLLEELKIVTL